LVASETRGGPQGRIRRYYRLTTKGRRELAAQRANWRSLAGAMSALGILDPVRS
jgi:DNA-binding PadR family transcriptional regulator